MAKIHTDKAYEAELTALREQLLEMGGQVEAAIAASVRSVVERDAALAEQVIANDDRIDHMEVMIDQRVIELIAKMQPTAVDLRFVAAVMKTTPELERIADLAQDVCERVLELISEPQIKRLVQLPRLAEDALIMVRQALDAFVRGDAELARQVIAHDDEVDQLTVDSFRALLTYMLEDARNISPAIRLTFIGKYFERMADGATNICEQVVYLVEGTMIKHAELKN